MTRLVEVLVGVLTLGLPVWFAFLDRKASPRLRWIGEGDPPPPWGRIVVVVGIGLAILIALAAPITGFEPSH